MSLRDLRVVQHMIQADVAQSLGIEQDSVSRMEHRKDVKVSTAANYVEALGGRLRLVAEFPGRRPYSVKIGDIADHPKLPRRGNRKS